MSEQNSGCVMYEDPKAWAFFEKEGASWLNKNVVIRTAESSAHQCTFFFMGKRIVYGPSTPRHTVVKFSKYEGGQLLKFLNNIIHEIHEFKDTDGLIPFLGKMENAKVRAFEKPSAKNRIEFWETPDFKLATSSIRITYNQIVGKYEMHILNPVSAEIRVKHNGWPGPAITLRESSINALRLYIMYELGISFDETD